MPANGTLGGGFIIEGGSARIYHAGDTAYFAGFSEMAAAFRLWTARCFPSVRMSQLGSWKSNT